MDEIQLKMYMVRIDMYKNHIKHLERNKPYFFQKKKLKKYNEEIIECMNKINNIYKQINDDIIINKKLL